MTLWDLFEIYLAEQERQLQSLQDHMKYFGVNLDAFYIKKATHEDLDRLARNAGLNMGSHDGEIHIRDEQSDFLERTGGGIPCYRTLCGAETVDWELSNPVTLPRAPALPPEPTCMGCVLVNLQNKAEEQHGR